MNIENILTVTGVCAWTLIGCAIAMATGHAQASALAVTYVVMGLFIAVVLTNHLIPRQ